jgi:hypothetical protein
VKLEFLAKREVWELDKVYGFSAVRFYDFVGYGKRFEVSVYYAVFVFGSQDFKGFVRGCPLGKVLCALMAVEDFKRASKENPEDSISGLLPPI